MRRLPDWEGRLVAWAEGLLGRAFAWGRTDCVLLAWEALDAMCDTALAARWRDAWRTRHQAREAARRHTLEAELLAVGAHPVAATHAQPGDILTLAGGRLPRAYVCLGRKVLSAAPRAGVLLLDASLLRCRQDVFALRVG